MALWKEPAKTPLSNPPDSLNLGRFGTAEPGDVPPPPATTPAVPAAKGAAAPAARTDEAASHARSGSESHIAPDLVIEGKIEGAGHVRIAGSFKGDINVRGDVTIEHGAKVNGSVRAERVTIAGELIGNIETAAHVELQQSGSLSGDVKSTTFTVAKGSRMRGQAEFGWEDGKSAVTDIHKSNGHAGSGQ